MFAPNNIQYCRTTPQIEVGETREHRVGEHPNSFSPENFIPWATTTETVMSDPLASIIMRSFNEGWALRDTLPALRVQEYRHWELIVIDSGSTDGSVELIRAARPRHF